MTELERHLLNALETLQSEQKQQWSSLQTACDSLLRLYETTKKENASLQGEVRVLRQQCEHLNEQIGSLATQIGSLKV